MTTRWVDRLLKELKDADERAKTLTQELNLEQLNWQPGPGTWSVGQCLEHLCITNEHYLGSIAVALDSKTTGAVQEIRLGWFSSWFIRSYIEPSPKTKRASAPKKIVPSRRVELSVLARFLSDNREVRHLIIRAADYDVNRIRFANPLVPGIRFTIGAGLQIICSHERRHLLQAEQVKGSRVFQS